MGEGGFLGPSGSDSKQSGLLPSPWGSTGQLVETDPDCVVNLSGNSEVLSQAPRLLHMKSYHLPSRGPHLGFLPLPVTSTKRKAHFSEWQEARWVESGHLLPVGWE